MANMKKLRRDYGDVIWTGKKCIMGLPISFTRYILTTTVLYTKIGFFNIKEDEIDLYKIVDKTMKFTLGQRMVGCGTIVVTSRDCDTPNKELVSVKKPRQVKKLLDEAVHLLNAGAGAFRDAHLAALVEDFGVLALLRGHRLDNGFDTLEGVVVDVNVLESLAHTGNHRGEFLEVAHFLDLLNLAEELVEVELVFLDFALQFLGFLLVVLGLCALHEADNVAHAEDAVGH